MLLGIFGGSFDPVHNGHLALAQACQAQAALDEVWFTPTAVQPLKQKGPHATDAERVEMLRLAIESESQPGCLELAVARHPRPASSWRVCTLEVERGGYSYTVDTLRDLRVELPEAKLFFMIGADAMRDIPHWKEPAEIFRMATPLVVRRAGRPEPDMRELVALCTADTQPRLVEMPSVDVSSTTIRARVAGGESIEDMVPAAVAEYIAQKRIYC